MNTEGEGSSEGTVELFLSEKPWYAVKTKKSTLFMQAYENNHL